MKTVLPKQRFTKDTPKDKCEICSNYGYVYMRTKLKQNHSEDTIFCSKKCVKRGFGGIILPKKQ